jgi:DNA-binding transcriptional LysR family regulator
MDSEIELRHLRYFAAVAEELHFGRAANKLHISQPPLSQQIRRFEDLVGYAVLTRTSRAVKLTAAGTAMLDRAKRTLHRVQEDLEFVRRVGRGETGPLRVGFIGSGMLTELPAILGKYRRLYPDVQLRLQELYTSNLAEAIRDGSVDVGFLRDGGAIPDLHVEPLLEEKLIAVVPGHHRLARQRMIRVPQLRHEPFVFFPISAGRNAWEQTMKLCEQHGFQANIVQEGPHWMTILSLVAAGLGVTIAPQCIRKIAGESVACKPLSPSGTTRIELAYRRDDSNPVTREFCRLVRALFAKSRLAQPEKSFVAQGSDRIDAHSSTSGQVAGRNRNRHQSQSHGNKSKRVRRADAKQHTGQQPVGA